MKESSIKQPGIKDLFLALGIAVVYFAVIYVVWGFYYAINDDVIMRNISSGMMTGEPDGHLIFVKYILGWLISRAFIICPVVDWYGLTLMAVMCFSLAVLLYMGLRLKRSFGWKSIHTAVTLLLYTAVMFLHIVWFEWTLAAVAPGMAAVSLLFVRNHENEKQRLLDDLLIAFCIWIMFCIRKSIFLMFGPMVGIFWLWDCREHKAHKSYLKKQLLAPFLSAVLLLLTIIVELTAYNSPAWKSYDQWNTARSDVMDYYGIPAYEEYPEFYESIETTPDEVRSLRHYALYLAEGMENGKMGLIGEKAAEIYDSSLGSLKAKCKAAVLLVMEGFVSSAYFPVNILSVAAILLAFLVSFFYDKKYLLLCVGMTFIQGLLWIGLGFKGRLPERVVFSMHMADLTMGMSIVLRIAFRTQCQIRKTAGRIAGGVLLAGLLFPAVFSLVETTKISMAKQGACLVYRQYQQELQRHKDSIYIADNHMEASRGAKVTIGERFRFSNFVTLGDWYSYSPLDTRRMERLGIEDIEEALVTKDNVYFVSDRNISYVQEALTDRFGEISTKTVQVYDTGVDFPYNIYQFSLKQEEDHE